MSNAVAHNHRSSPAKKKSYADVANSSKSTPSSANAFIPSEHFLARLEFLLGSRETVL